MPHQLGLGRWVDFDPQSLDYRFTATVRRKSVLHADSAPITDQDGWGGCVGYTDLDVLNTAKFAKSRLRGSGGRHYLPNDLGLKFYSLATEIDEWPDEKFPPDDTGTSVLSGAKALKRLNYIDRYEWALTFLDFLAALERQPVMLGTLWTSEMYDPDRSGLVVPKGDLAGGHAYMARGVNYSTERIRCRNHWRKDWGVKGEFYVTFADMEWLLSQQGDAVVPIPVG